MEKSCWMIFISLLMAGHLFSVSLYAENSPSQLQKKIGDSIAAGQQGQAEADAWAAEKETLLEKIRDQKRKKEWLIHQIRKYDTYREKYAENTDALEKRRLESEEIRMELEPWLEEVPERMEAAVQNDLPFLREEREKRIVFLRESLDDYRLSLAEKTARIFEALHIESAYGYGTEIRNEIIRIKGEDVRVKMLRLGRTVMYFQTPDGNEAGWFNREKREWEFLAPEYRNAVCTAFGVAEKEQVPVFTDLPVGRAQ